MGWLGAATLGKAGRESVARKLSRVSCAADGLQRVSFWLRSGFRWSYAAADGAQIGGEVNYHIVGMVAAGIAVIATVVQVILWNRSNSILRDIRDDNRAKNRQ